MSSASSVTKSSPLSMVQQIIQGNPWCKIKRRNHLKESFKFLENHTVSLIGAGIECGQGHVGCSETTEVFRKRYVERAFRGQDPTLSWSLRDCGDLPFREQWARQRKSSAADPCDLNVKNSHQVGLFNELISNEVEREARNGNFVLTIGGDHSIGFGTVHGVLKARPDTVVVWVDAHADINTPETSFSGNMHGMPVAAQLGLFDFAKLPGFQWISPLLKPENLAYIGLRDLDPFEKEVLHQLKIPSFTMHSLDQLGIGEVMKQTMEAINPNLDRPIHLSFDIDSIDPNFAPSTGTIADGGISLREAHFICEFLSNTGCLTSMDLAEVNPSIIYGAPAHGDGVKLHELPFKTSDVGLTVPECVKDYDYRTLDLSWKLIESILDPLIHYAHVPNTRCEKI